MSDTGGGALQVFFWVGPSYRHEGKTYYQQFSLNDQVYNLGDCGEELVVDSLFI
jgi:hypothetical protein